MPKSRILQVFFLILSFSIIQISLVNGQVGTVGVSEGDWFKWSYSYSFPDDQTVPASLDIDWIKFSVTDISGTLVNGEAIIKYNNGTEYSEPNSIDIDTDISPLIREMLISTHYSEGDQINNSQHLDIDGITNVTYLNEPREMFYSSFVARSNDLFLTEEYYWDKQTGILIEMSVNQELTAESTLDSGASTLEVKLIESNIPQIPEISSPLFTIVLVLSASLLVILSKRKLITA